ncbi:MAG: class II aldolase/adducin family protein, partial [Deltaproteobacteria bacterium]|nr:class II aldolase/adducin family protein [Deltaproteobacteria bacterium]
MKPEYEKELRGLTPRQYNIVMGGLLKKLDHHKKTGILSYAYEICPVCKDIGSTLEEQHCEECYIHKSCQAPFTEGFEDDTNAGVAYFTEMRRFMDGEICPPRTLIVGGTWDDEGGHQSKIVEMLAKELDAEVVHNGGDIIDLDHDISGFDLIVWMPSVSNGESKWYPKKDRGAVLVCSKVMRSEYTKADSVSRIFAMHANAVIEIRRGAGAGKFLFGLRDAMANWWAEPTTDIVNLVSGIMEHYWWTKGSIRIGSKRSDLRDNDTYRLMELTGQVADRVENSIGERYFGNVSTRCQSMFPGARGLGHILISPRNTDKRRLGAEDMVMVSAFQDAAGEGSVRYWGPRKPSVDTPVQLYIFGAMPEV